MKRIFLALALGALLLFPDAVHAQIVPFYPNGATGPSEIPVVDDDVGNNTWKTLAQVILQLKDMLTNSKRWSEGTWNSRTGQLLNEIARYKTANEILYGSDGSTVWGETYALDHTWDNGSWIEHELERDSAALNTQRTLLHHLEMMHQEDEVDEERIQELQARVDDSVGRNQIEQANAMIQAETLQQIRKERQATVTLANAVTVAAGHQINEKAAERAQEREFLSNFHRKVEFPVFTDRGL